MEIPVAVLELLNLEQSAVEVLELLGTQVEGFSAVTWRVDATGASLLHVAVVLDLLELMEGLLEKGCDVNAPDVEGRTPLYTACEMGRLGAVKVLVGHGADVHKANVRATWELNDGTGVYSTSVGGITALTCALFFGHFDIVDYLLANGALPDSQTLAVAINKGTMLEVRHALALVNQC